MSRLPDPDAAFAEPWEARVFALAVTMSQAGHFTWPEWSEALGARAKASGCGEANFEIWLDTLEALLIEKAAADRGALDALRSAWREAAEATPHGSPIELAPGFAATVASR